jgi:glucose/mannose-6-phosphate isomerase
MSFTHKLTLDDIRRTDKSDMAGHIAGMGEHIREAITFSLQGLSRATLPQNISSIVVAGMGGSAIGGDFVRSYLGSSLRVPLLINRSYDLPSYANASTLVIASSYSGNTEETLSQFAQARESKCPIICITTGGKLGALAKENGIAAIALREGMQPRAAFAYSFVPALLILEKLGLANDAVASLQKAATFLDTLAERYGTQHLNEGNGALMLASQLMHRIPVIYSSSDYEAVCLRWRGQIHENAKHLAFGNVLPEMSHNEIEGWAHPADLIAHMFAVLLRSEDEHPQITKRLEFLKQTIVGKQVPVVEVKAEGSSRLERMLNLISMADWTSFYLALLAGTDPTPIPVMENLKLKLQ